MKVTTALTALAAVLMMAGCSGGGNPSAPSNSYSNEKVCDESGRVFRNEQEALREGLDRAQFGATYCRYITKVCDQFGNVYESEKMAQRAGLSEAQYGASYCKN